MSTRTIIEINHDYLSSGQYRDTEAALIALLYGLRSCNWQETRHAHEPAFRVLGQRHHSDPEWAPSNQSEGE